jgi:hypothetical protein
MLRLKIVKDEKFNEKSKTQISHLVSEFFGKKMNHKCEIVDEIKKEPSGKYRFTICNVEHELL